MKALIALGLAALSGAAQAQGSVDALLAKHNCLSCHDRVQAKVGPTFKEIGKRYADDKRAPDALATAIIEGSYQAWGEEAMPPNPKVTAEEAKAIVAWILKL